MVLAPDSGSGRTHIRAQRVARGARSCWPTFLHDQLHLRQLWWIRLVRVQLQLYGWRAALQLLVLSQPGTRCSSALDSRAPMNSVRCYYGCSGTRRGDWFARRVRQSAACLAHSPPHRWSSYGSTRHVRAPEPLRKRRLAIRDAQSKHRSAVHASGNVLAASGRRNVSMRASYHPS